MANHSFHNRKWPAALALAVALAMLVTGAVPAAGGTLDPTFGGDGKVTTDFGGRDAGADLAIQPDGKIIVAGNHEQDVALARYRSDGSLDPTFDADGKLTSSLGGFNLTILAVALQPDGKIVVAGRRANGFQYDIGLARFNSDGSLDTSFDTDGKVSTDFRPAGFPTTDDSATDLAIQPDGKIVVAGYSVCLACPALDRDRVLARYNSNGSLDTTFDGDGKVGPVLQGLDRAGFAVALQPDGKVLVAGSTWAAFGESLWLDDFWLARFNSDGSADVNFGTNGEVLTDFSASPDGARGIALQPDGKIVTAGASTVPSLGPGPNLGPVLNAFALARYHSDGSPDTTFDGDGKATTVLNTGNDAANDVALQSDGKIVVVGRSDNGLNLDFTLARYNSDGSLDSTFDTDGILMTDFGHSDDAISVAIQSGDRIVVAGWTNDDFALARYADYGFEDVLPGYWAREFVERLYAAGITGGCSTAPRLYCPEATVTRAQMAVFLERGIHGSSYNPPAVGTSTGFSDVLPTYWAAAWIKQLAAEGITGGCGTGTYCPEAPVTRAQMAVFLLRSKHGASYNPPAVGGSTGFSDVPPTYWAAAWIKQLVAEGITSGCGAGTYCPEAPVTRAQMAVFLVRTFNLP